MIKTLIKNELLKLYYSKKLLLSLIILGLLAAIICYSFYNEVSSQKNDANIQNRINLLKNEIQNIDNADIGKMEQQLHELEENKDNPDKLSIEDTKLMLNSALENKNSSSYEKSTDIEKNQINNSILLLSYFDSNNIIRRQSFEIMSFESLQRFINYTSQFFIMVIISILSADILTKEYYPKTLNTLFTKPVSRRKIFIAKYISAVIACTSILLTIEVLIFLTMGLLSNFPSMNYPILTGTNFTSIDLGQGVNQSIPILGTTHIIPLWNFLLRLVGLQILSIICVVSLSMIITTVAKSSMNSIFMNMVISLILLNIPNQGISGVIKSLTYANYSNTMDVLGQPMLELASPFIPENALVSQNNALIFLPIWALVFFCIAYFIYNKKHLSLERLIN